MENRYVKLVFAILAATLVLIIAILFSQYLSNSQFSSVSQNLQQVQQGLQELQVLSSLGASNSTVSCAILTSGFNGLSSQLSQLGSQAQAADYENQTGSQYVQLVDELSYARIEYWLLSQRIDLQCADNLTTVLLFYKPQNCGSCTLEGSELTYLQQLYPNLASTALDGEWNLPVINALNQVYNLTISQYPVIIVNGKYIITGYQTTSQLLSDMCKYTNKTEFCDGNV